MKKPTKPACKKCRFWDIEATEAMDLKSFGDIGWCYRFPPDQIDEEMPTTQWPTTHNDSWCGEFEEKKS